MTIDGKFLGFARYLDDPGSAVVEVGDHVTAANQSGSRNRGDVIRWLYQNKTLRDDEFHQIKI